MASSLKKYANEAITMKANLKADPSTNITHKERNYFPNTCDACKTLVGVGHRCSPFVVAHVISDFRKQANLLGCALLLVVLLLEALAAAAWLLLPHVAGGTATDNLTVRWLHDRDSGDAVLVDVGEVGMQSEATGVTLGEWRV